MMDMYCDATICEAPPLERESGRVATYTLVTCLFRKRYSMRGNCDGEEDGGHMCVTGEDIRVLFTTYLLIVKRISQSVYVGQQT